jgi:hypothetical protein
MKNLFLYGSIYLCITLLACNNSKEESAHVHEDGTSHSDHDTTKPVQQEFTVGDTTTAADTSNKQHTHEDGNKHSH